MIMKKVKLISGIALSLISLVITSCEDFLDVNQDPNNASNATPTLALPAGIASAAARLSTNYNIMGGMWVQFWAQNNGSNQYKGFDAYQVQQATNNGDFNELYSGALQDLQYTRTESKATGDWNLYLMGTVMQSYVFQMLADLYDEIPFDEALQGSINPHPHFRSGQVVYDSLIERIDVALSKDFDALTNTDPGNADLLFQGDVNEWIKFANTLKLKIYLRQVYARPAVAQAGIEALYASGAEFLDDHAAMTQFVDQENKSNPLYEMDQRKLNTKENIRASKTFMDFLLENDDPRVDALFIPGSSGQRGIEQGNFGAPTTQVNPASISRALIQPTDPVYFITKAESYFLQAEAAARGFGTGDAEALFNLGVDAAFERLGLDNPGIYTYPNGTLEQNLEAIAIQKWASFAGIQGLEAFFERNRLGYPEYNNDGYTDDQYEIGQLVYPIGGSTGLGNYPKRLLFPETEQNRNPNTPTEVPFLTKVWWDVKP
jgi:hypothetical protein